VKPLGRPGQVVLVGLGEVKARVLAEVGAALREVLALPAKAGPSLDRPDYAFNKDRRQYHAPAIVRRLSTLRPSADGAPVVGIVDADLFVPDAPYVIGDADRDAGAAVFSITRLASPEPKVVRRRAQVEAVHGAGHLLGLSHCLDYRCAMFLSKDATDSDRKGPGLCPSCRSALGLP